MHTYTLPTPAAGEASRKLPPAGCMCLFKHFLAVAATRPFVVVLNFNQVNL